MVYLFNHEVLKKDFKHDCIQNRSHKMIFIEIKLIIRVFYRFLVKSWKKAILSSWFYIIFVLFANHIYKNNIFFLNGIQEIKKFKLYSTFVLLIGNLRVFTLGLYETIYLLYVQYYGIFWNDIFSNKLKSLTFDKLTRNN